MTTREQLRAWWNPHGLPSPVTVPGLSRQELARRLAEIGLRKWVEIGVADGRFARQIMAAVPDLTYIGVDPYETYRGNRRGGTQVRHDRNRAAAQELVDGSRDAILLIATSEQAIFHVTEADVVYIDGNHDFDYVMLDLIKWRRKLTAHGVMAGHDFYEFRHGGVMPAVTAYTAAHGLEWYLTDGTADPGSDKHPSFFWAVD